MVTYVYISFEFVIMISMGYFKRFLEARFSNPDSHRKLRAKEEASYMHFLDFLEECDGRILIIMQFSIPVTLLLQYIGDLQRCVSLFRGNCCTVNGMTITLQHLLIFCTGADHEPPLGFQKQAVLEFLILKCYQQLPRVTFILGANQIP